MLWEKETSESDALYVDYLANFGDNLVHLDEMYEKTQLSVKNDSVSFKLRVEGNVQFAARNQINAIQAYNCALCFAENGSESISQAYANRSACLFQLDQFKESFIDNVLAFNASDCSDELKQRLEQNKRDCSDFFGYETDENDEIMPKLDYPPNKSFPSLANVLQIERHIDANEDRHRVVANCDIDVGKKILVEKSPVSKLLGDHYMRCCICLKKSYNLVPCKHCTSAMFCYGECQTSTLHEAECNLNANIDIEGKLSFLTRTVLYAIGLFDSVDDLMEFFEQKNSSDTSYLPSSTINERAKYQNFSNLRPHTKTIRTKNCDPMIYFAYRAITESNIGRKLFKTLRHKRFLIHLIWQHLAIISLGYVHEFTDKKNEFKTQNLSVTYSYMNHSCTPNAMFHLVDNWEIVTVIRPIKAGEEVYLSYFDKECFLGKHEERQQYLGILNDCYGFICYCDLCKQQTASDDERTAMANDPSYQFILRSNTMYSFKKIPIDGVLMKNHAIKFLQKFGRYKWCEEISEAARCFMDMTWLISNP